MSLIILSFSSLKIIGPNLGVSLIKIFDTFFTNFRLSKSKFLIIFSASNVKGLNFPNFKFSKNFNLFDFNIRLNRRSFIGEINNFLLSKIKFFSITSSFVVVIFERVFLPYLKFFCSSSSLINFNDLMTKSSTFFDGLIFGLLKSLLYITFFDLIIKSSTFFDGLIDKKEF